MSDTTLPALTGLEFRTVIDLREGDQVQAYAVRAEDEAGIVRVVLWFDRKIIDNVGGFEVVVPAWTEAGGVFAATRVLSRDNAPGLYTLLSVMVDDLAGHSRRYDADALREAGLPVAFEMLTPGYDPTEGDDGLSGSAGIDVLDGRAGNDAIAGLAGHDTLFGGAGDDTLLGGEGDDLLIGGSGGNRLDGGAGTDGVRFQGRRADHAVHHAADGTLLVSGASGVDTLSGIEHFVFDDWSGDSLNTAPEALALSAQRVPGSARVGDVVAALSAFDAEGDPLRFTLAPGTDDALRLAGDRLVLAKSLGPTPGSLRVVVEAADDYGGTTRAEFDLAADALDAPAPPLPPPPPAPGLVLRGDAGRNDLWGGSGSDRLIGGPGADSLHGGAGPDAFVFTRAKDSTASARGRDTVFDFRHAEGDRIDLKALDADATARGNQAFAWIGGHGFHKHPGELRAERIAGGLLVSGDLDGDGAADIAIRVTGVTGLVKGDFVL
ncbi:MAG: calcium-binding protein [Microvirga sp.]